MRVVQTYFNHTLIEVVTRLAGGEAPGRSTPGPAFEGQHAVGSSIAHADDAPSMPMTSPQAQQSAFTLAAASAASQHPRRTRSEEGTGTTAHDPGTRVMSVVHDVAR